MKKILGIIGSKRASGNCEIMTKAISKEVPEEHQLTLLRLPDFNLNYCNGCYRCLVKDQGCILKDDLALVLQAIGEADALIVTAPTYFLSAHSCLKVFSERAISFYSMADTLWGKPAVAVGVAGIEGKEGSTLLDLERFLSTIMADNKGKRIVYGALPGEVVLNEENLQVAKQLGSSLLGSGEVTKEIHCQSCGGETFRFLSGSTLRCMLCSSEGSWTAENGRFELSIDSDSKGTQFLSDKEQALKHRDWLLGMVGRFHESKEALKEVAAEYEDDTEWILPGRKRKSVV
jgi:multimeric flavodoxin WrbA